MQCNKCGYEPSLKEIQAGEECPACAEKDRRAQAVVRPPQFRPQEVVVVDLNMSFPAMVRFMVMWVLASIPALIILAIIFGGLAAIFSLIARH
jgi:hypothetical protein